MKTSGRSAHIRTALATMLLASTILHGQSSVSANESRSLEEIDDLIEQMQRSVWRTTRQMGELHGEHYRAGLEDDLARHLLTDTTLERITHLRKRAMEAGGTDSPGNAGEALSQLAQVLDAEQCRFTLLGTYWSQQYAHEYHQEAIAALLADLPESEQNPFRSQARDILLQTEAARERALVATPACVPVGERYSDMIDRWNLQMSAYNQLRLAVLTRIRALPNGEPREAPAVQRPSPCPEKTATTTGTSRHRLDERGDLADFYPPRMSNLQVTGQVLIRIVTDTTGCVAKVSVVRGSGTEELDAAAVRYGFTLEFTPAEENGEPMAGSFLQTVNFNMVDPDNAE